MCYTARHTCVTQTGQGSKRTKYFVNIFTGGSELHICPIFVCEFDSGMKFNKVLCSLQVRVFILIYSSTGLLAIRNAVRSC